MSTQATDEPVPLMNLGLMHEEIKDEVAEGFARVLSSGAFVGGPDVAAFEDEFATYSGRRFAVGTANGTDAVEFAVRAAGLGIGDEVIIPANTFVATAEAVCRAGATPVACDVTADTLLIDVASAETVRTGRTRAIIPVHLFGQMAPMADVHAFAARHDLIVIEDAAQAQGATQAGAGIGAGSFAAATSFYPGKNLGAYGDAGAVVCDDQDVVTSLRLLGNHGSSAKYVHSHLGFNSRLDTLQAVVLRAKLSRLDGWNQQRNLAAERYAKLLEGSDVGLPATAPGNEHVWHLYVVRVKNRQEVMNALVAHKVGAAIHYPVPVHLQPAFASTAAQGSCPVAERAADEILSLPFFPGITDEQQERVAAALVQAVG